MALAPSRALLSVPSRSMSVVSTPRWSSASSPIDARRAISPLTLPTAVCDALAAEAGAAVAQLDRLVLAGRGARRARSPGRVAPGREHDLDLDGGVAARVEDLAADDVLDLAHATASPASGSARVGWCC